MAAFRFGFDLPNHAEDVPSSCDKSTFNESPSADDSGECTSSAPATKPKLCVLDLPPRKGKDDIESVAVPLLPRDGAVGPLRRAVPPPNVVPSLSAATSAGRDTDTAMAVTDLIPGVYEGGLKVWECSLDLCRYLASEIDRLLKEGGEPSTVEDNDCRWALSSIGKTLELGCGHGLPGCLVLRELRKRWGGSHSSTNGFFVLFSDYNEFVLKEATMPNILVNLDQSGPVSSSAMHSCIACVAGDWMDLSKRLQCGTLAPHEGADGANASKISDEHSSRLPSDGRFDLILAAETTYTSASAKDTALLLGRHLKVGSGVGLIATKRYYFGVGGGAGAFRAAASKVKVNLRVNDGDWIRECNCRLSVETILEYDNGAGNIRDLLRVRLLCEEG